MLVETVVTTIKETGVVAILRGVAVNSVMETVAALYSGGIRAVEITANTASACDMIRQIAREYCGKLHVGAGTVLNKKSALQAIESGAEFVLAPNTDAEVIAIVKKHGIAMIPGAFTPTEILRCHDSGADMIKVFPVSSVGPQYIKDLRGPFGDLRLLPVGGVDLTNAGAFLKAGADAIGVGSSLVSRDLTSRKDFHGIEALAGEFLQAVREAKGSVSTANA
jgi:2-dehydro-3-deoxyphosphogluconate aldolase/(4S)-4-hydroxy-2-oxoglutarate aldolase